MDGDDDDVEDDDEEKDDRRIRSGDTQNVKNSIGLKLVLEGVFSRNLNYSCGIRRFNLTLPRSFDETPR